MSKKTLIDELVRSKIRWPDGPVCVRQVAHHNNSRNKLVWMDVHGNELPDHWSYRPPIATYSLAEDWLTAVVTKEQFSAELLKS